MSGAWATRWSWPFASLPQSKGKKQRKQTPDEWFREQKRKKSGKDGLDLDALIARLAVTIPWATLPRVKGLTVAQAFALLEAQNPDPDD